MTKSPALYRRILIAWLILVFVAMPALIGGTQQAFRHGAITGWLEIVSALFVVYFWLNGVKDVAYTWLYRRNRHQLLAPAAERTEYIQPQVVLLYTTCNDFEPESLAASMKQDYVNLRTVILDDSTRRSIRAEIDSFAWAHRIPVVRRGSNAGFKAGNLNNYLRQAQYDFFVLLDSDEIIPSDFVTRALDYFAANPGAGIVQANHIATRNRNRFMSRFARGVDAHWPAYQSVKQRYGFLSLLGHGAMVSRSCYVAAGGFPHVVAEDLCFAIRAREKGYLTVFAPDIVCEEEYPVDYFAFKKRHGKWTQGNMEFIKQFTGEIYRGSMTWFEKLDIVLFTYSLPLTCFFFAYLAINVVILPAFGVSVVWPLWLLVPTLLFLLAPMLNDICEYVDELTLPHLIGYCLSCFALYGSMFMTSLVSSTTSLFGRSTFAVTPKRSRHVSLWEAWYANRFEFYFATMLIELAYIFDRSPLPVILIAATAYSSIHLSLLSNQSSEKPIIKEDENGRATAVGITV